MILGDVLKRLAQDAFSSVDSGYYDVDITRYDGEGRILSNAIMKSLPSLVCEIKFASPSAGRINARMDQVSEIAAGMQRGGASALSVLTERRNFNGSLSNLIRAREATRLPVIMKDIIVSRAQIEAASRIGADAILLIYELFEKNLTSALSLEEALALAHDLDLEVIVETSSEKGLERLLRLDDLDIIGINNRDLDTFEVRLDRTIDLLTYLSENRSKGRRTPIIMSESGYEEPSDIASVLNGMDSKLVPNAFLIGTSIMRSGNIEAKVQEFASVLR